jgi:hypothetical protein
MNVPMGALNVLIVFRKQKNLTSSSSHSTPFFCVRETNTNSKDEILPSELQDNGGLSLFGDNLGSCSKLLRLSTLRLLVHFESVSAILLDNNSKRRKGIDGRPCVLDSTSESVWKTLYIHLFLLV